MTKEEMSVEFEITIRKFVDHREKHGGILLPDKIIIDGAYEDAMDRTGQRKKPEHSAHIFRKK